MSGRRRTEQKVRQRLKDDLRHYAERCLKIRTKSGTLERLRLNKVQIHIHERLEAQRAKSGRVRALILKARQPGVSTYVGARFYWKVTHGRGLRAFILTHRDQATANLFAMAKRFLDNDHVRVILLQSDGGESLWTEGSEYSLSGAGAPGGGTVTVATSPSDYTPQVGEALIIKLGIPAEQQTALPLGGAFPSTAVEGMADLAALRDQQIEEALSRAVKFKETTALADVEFPEPEAGKPIAWNSTGDGLENRTRIGNWQGDWATATDYESLDIVRVTPENNIYVCEVAHTSGVFATDLAANRWSLAINVQDVETATTNASASASAAGTSASNAANSATASAGSETAAATSATGAATSETNAANSASAAGTSATNAATSATSANTSDTAAAASASAALGSAAASETARVAAVVARTGAETAETGAVTARNAAEALYGNLAAVDAARVAAEAAQTAAVTSETNAASSETAAAGSASSAGTSATSASGSATAANNSAAAASTSQTAASVSATSAGASATNATSSASSAGISETNAANSASAASTSATEAATSETNASASETAATGAATSATGSATSASSDATAAAASATSASSDATAAAASASSASSSAISASNSATNAATFETNAAASETASAASAIAADLFAILNTTSATSNAVGLGSKVLTTADVRSFAVGGWVIVAQATNADNFMIGQVSAWDSGTQQLTVNVTNIGGTGTISNWNIQGTGRPGDEGPAGALGAAADGSETLPSFGFSLDTDTGIWRAGTDILAASAGGVEAWRAAEVGGVVTTTFSGPTVARSDVVADKTASFVFALAEADRVTPYNSASAGNATIPPNASVAFPVGTMLCIVQEGAGAPTWVAGAGVTLNVEAESTLNSKGQHAVSFAIQLGTDVWTIAGNLESV